MTIDLQNLFAGCAGMEACTEDLSKYAEAAAKRDALEEKLKTLQAEYEAAKKDVENIETWAHGTRQDERAVALILHHDVDPRLKSAYDRSEDLPHKRKVLDAWGKFCFSECENG